ncbi:hypothetical protein [Mameliella alba]|uniref:hypothetical protein n=1 Tax=Mameliella alba TaxID=561184 RepID=UPI0010549A7C|nr:hypothetical protein [Mameliella alba]
MSELINILFFGSIFAVAAFYAAARLRDFLREVGLHRVLNAFVVTSLHLGSMGFPLMILFMVFGLPPAVPVAMMGSAVVGVVVAILAIIFVPD